MAGHLFWELERVATELLLIAKQMWPPKLKSGSDRHKFVWLLDKPLLGGLTVKQGREPGADL